MPECKSHVNMSAFCDYQVIGKVGNLVDYGVPDQTIL